MEFIENNIYKELENTHITHRPFGAASPVPPAASGAASVQRLRQPKHQNETQAVTESFIWCSDLKIATSLVQNREKAPETAGGTTGAAL